MLLTAADVELRRVQLDTRAEFPRFNVVDKAKYWYMRWIDALLKAITFGHMTGFMNYTTTWGTTVYTPEHWADTTAYDQAVVLRHERVHMRQRQRMGSLAFIFLYLFWPLPILFAQGRRNLEIEAYEETLRAHFEYYGEFVAIDTGLRTRIVEHFLGADYFWMWPWREDIEGWYDDTVAKLAAEARKLHGQNQAR